MKTLKCFIGITYLFCNLAFAKQCSVNFNYGIVIDPTHIRMLDHGKTYVQINNDKQLFISGREIQLTLEQQTLINDYALGIRTQVPEIVSIALEGVDIGLKAVNKVIGGLTGENSASHQKIQQHFEEIKMRIYMRFNHSDQNYYLARQDFDNFDELFSGEFEQELEEIISQSVGTILMAVGEAMITTDNSELSDEQRTLSLEQRMENMGKELELEVVSQTNALENKADKFCQSLMELNKIEDELQQNIAELSTFNLLETN
ncbi:MAG: YggN family protein [Colwellia sp.]|nr:YggN family protein [Colwellia sp.]